MPFFCGMDKDEGDTMADKIGAAAPALAQQLGKTTQAQAATNTQSTPTPTPTPPVAKPAADTRFSSKPGQDLPKPDVADRFREAVNDAKKETSKPARNEAAAAGPEAAGAALSKRSLDTVSKSKPVGGPQLDPAAVDKLREALAERMGSPESTAADSARSAGERMAAAVRDSKPSGDEGVGIDAADKADVMAAVTAGLAAAAEALAAEGEAADAPQDVTSAITTAAEAAGIEIAPGELESESFAGRLERIHQGMESFNLTQEDFDEAMESALYQMEHVENPTLDDLLTMLEVMLYGTAGRTNNG